jgi:hypothetical protein
MLAMLLTKGVQHVRNYKGTVLPSAHLYLLAGARNLYTIYDENRLRWCWNIWPCYLFVS